MEPESIHTFITSMEEAIRSWDRLADHWRETGNIAKMEEAIAQLERCREQLARLQEALAESARLPQEKKH